MGGRRAAEGSACLLRRRGFGGAGVGTARACGVEVHRLPKREGRLDLRVAVDVLNGHHHIRSVLTEAGSALNGSLLRDQLVDKVVLYFAEQELGAVGDSVRGGDVAVSAAAAVELGGAGDVPERCGRGYSRQRLPA